MTGITTDGIELDRHFAAPPSAVFAAWTTAEHFARWFGGSAVDVPLDRLDFRPVVGRTWSATMVLPDGNTIDWAGDFLEVTPNSRFVFTLTDNPASPERAAVTVDLEATDTGTLMRMTQETPGFPTAQREATLAGWQTFMDALTTVAESA
jgi:uncharacterized protein YndB with AHSA1/START domain